MKFSKYRNPNRKPARRKSPYSEQYIAERKNEMYALLAETKTDAARDAIIKAFHITINP